MQLVNNNYNKTNKPKFRDNLTAEEINIISKYELIYSDFPDATILTDGDNLQIRRNKETGEYEVFIEMIWIFDEFEDFKNYLTVLKDGMLYKLGLEGKVADVNFDVPEVIAKNYTPRQIETYMYKKLEHYIRECLYLYDCNQPKYKMCVCRD